MNSDDPPAILQNVPKWEKDAPSNDAAEQPCGEQIHIPVPRIWAGALEASQERVVHDRCRCISQHWARVQEVLPARHASTTLEAMHKDEVQRSHARQHCNAAADYGAASGTHNKLFPDCEESRCASCSAAMSCSRNTASRLSGAHRNTTVHSDNAGHP